MISRIHSATVFVADQDAALAFYVNTLGWEKGTDATVDENTRWLTVVPPGATTQLVLARGGPAGSDTAPGRDSGITLVAPDVDATYEALSARGVRFKRPVTVMPWGAKATWFSDPDGNEFFLASE